MRKYVYNNVTKDSKEKKDSGHRELANVCEDCTIVYSYSNVKKDYTKLYCAFDN